VEEEAVTTAEEVVSEPEVVEASENITFGFATGITEAASSTQTEDGAEVVIAGVTTTEEITLEENDGSTVVDALASTTDGTDKVVMFVESTTTSEVTLPADQEIVSDSAPDCGTSCTGHVIHLNNFGYPLDEGVELSGAQLRMSFAAKHKVTREDVPSFTMNYSLDAGATWSTGGAVLIDDEVSNSINGGYYLFALPAITEQATLQDLHIELRYDNSPALVSELFVESVWLELFTLEPPAEEVETNFAELIENDGFKDTKLSGDVLSLAEEGEINFTFTDENEGETLIVKSSQKTYDGLSEATTYFSVTNEGDESDNFTVQTYFPSTKGEVTDLQVFNLNKPRQAVLPEYRPYVYHCEAGWDSVVNTPGAATSTDLVLATSSISATSTSVATSSVESNEVIDLETAAIGYSCAQASIVKTCETIEGEGTACIITEKVASHEVTQYAPGWDNVLVAEGQVSEGGL